IIKSGRTVLGIPYRDIVEVNYPYSDPEMPNVRSPILFGEGSNGDWLGRLRIFERLSGSYRGPTKYFDGPGGEGRIRLILKSGECVLLNPKNAAEFAAEVKKHAG